jgi:predicted NBD/HSP70 family sugar kinase
MPTRITAHGRTATQILEMLRRDGPLSRSELVGRTGLSAATISDTVRSLFVAGLVLEAGNAPRQGRGRSRRLLRLDASAWCAAGVHLGAASTTIALLDFAGERIAYVAIPGVFGTGPEPAARQVGEHIARLLHIAGLPSDRLLGVTLVAPGRRDSGNGTLAIPDFGPEWIAFPMVDTLAEIVGAPVYLENNANSAALGELRVGGASATFGLVHMGSTLEGSVVVDGEIFRGGANAVAIGHIPVADERSDCACGVYGCAESQAAPAAVIARAMRDKAFAARLGLLGSPGAVTADFDSVARAWRGGDCTAAAALERSAGLIGRAVAVFADLFGLETVVLTGSAFRIAGRLYREHIETALEGRDEPFARPVAVRLSSLTDAAAIGGALQVFRSAPVPL